MDSFQRDVENAGRLVVRRIRLHYNTDNVEGNLKTTRSAYHMRSNVLSVRRTHPRKYSQPQSMHSMHQGRSCRLHSKLLYNDQQRLS